MGNQYNKVCDFLIHLNEKDTLFINWNWARWEWMYWHQEFDKSLENTIGLWEDDGKIVGAAIYDQYYGEAFCGCIPKYQALLPEIINYAYSSLKDDDGIGIAINGRNIDAQKIIESCGFHKDEQTENILSLDMNGMQNYDLSDGLKIRTINPKTDAYAYQWVLWQGFDHGNNIEEFLNQTKIEILSRLHFNQELCLAVVDKDDHFVAHCNGWYISGTDYIYVEPVCVIPEYRGKNIGTAIVKELLNRGFCLGAKKAYVISDQVFYYKLGFRDAEHFTFWWKE